MNENMPRGVVNPEPPVRALLIAKRWLDAILQGEKTIEIRGRRCHISGTTYLCETKTGLVRGIATLGPCHELTEQEKEEHKDALVGLRYTQPWAISLLEVTALSEPWTIPAPARRGCVQWILRDRWEAALRVDELDANRTAQPEKKRQLQ